MDNPRLPAAKKGLSPLAWLGIGCAGVIGLAILGLVIVSVFFGGQIKEFAAEMEKNPIRATATTMIKVTGGQFEMVAEDDVNQRYTVREKKTGKLTTFYFDEKTKAPGVIEGDFTAIPAAPAAPPEPAPSTVPIN